MPLRLPSLARLLPGPPDSDQELVYRYAETGDERSFAALVDRHGPTVHGVCRRVLRDTHLADEAFQATFLLLARKAGALKDAAAVGSWLFGVARRVALAARRQEQRAVPRSPRGAVAKPGDGRNEPATQTSGQSADWDDLLRVLDEELAKLPDKYRAPLIACYLQGLTQDEAAKQLGSSLSTLRRRLEQARELLKSRMQSRGATLSAGLFAGALAPSAGRALAAPLRQAAIATGTGAAVPASVVSLAKVGVGSTFVLKALAVGIGSVLTLGFTWGAATLYLASTSKIPTQAYALNGGDEDDTRSVPRTFELLPNPWREPLPANALARLGTTAFRHGTDAPAGTAAPVGVWQLAYQPDGTLVSVGGERVRFWEPGTGQELHAAGPAVPARHRHRSHVYGDGRFYLVPDADNPLTAAVWDLTTRAVIRTVTFRPHPGRASATLGPTAVSADGGVFAEVDAAGDVWVWDEDGKPVSKLAVPGCTPGRLFLTPDGQTAVTVTADQGIGVWAVRTGAKVREFGGGLPEVRAAALSPDGRWFVTFGGDPDEAEPDHWKPDRHVRLWDVGAGEIFRAFRWPVPPLHGTHRVRLAFTPDSRSLVGLDVMDTHTVSMSKWSVIDSAAATWTLPARGLNPAAVAVNPVGDRVAVGDGGTVRLYDLTRQWELIAAPAHDAAVKLIRFDTTRGRVTTLAANNEARTWDAATGAPVGVINPTPDFPTVPPGDWGPDETPIGAAGNLVVLRTKDGIVGRLLDGRQKRFALPLARYLDGGTATGFALCTDGSALAIGLTGRPGNPGERGRVVVIELPSGRVRWQTALADSAPIVMQFSLDDQRLAVGTRAATVYDATNGAKLLTFDGHRGAVTALTFRPDGKVLATGSTDSTVLLWRMPE